jgi:hypothetical protein
LTPRMRVPCGPRPWLERHCSACGARRRRRREQWIDTYRARESISRSFRGRLRTCSSNVHGADRRAIEW